MLYAKFTVRDEGCIQNCDLLWIFNLAFSHYIYIASMKGINGQSPGGVLQKIYFDEFRKVHRKTLALDSPFS